MEVIRRSFTPEFRNRLDAVVQFQALGFEHILRVVDKFLIELEVQLHDKNVTLSATPAARDWLAAARLRPADGRAPDGARDPGQDQAPAGGRAAVRQAGRRRPGHHRRASDDELVVEAQAEPEKLLPVTVVDRGALAECVRLKRKRRPLAAFFIQLVTAITSCGR